MFTSGILILRSVLYKGLYIHYKEYESNGKYYKERFILKILYKELLRFLFLAYQHLVVIFIIAQVIYSC